MLQDVKIKHSENHELTLVTQKKERTGDRQQTHRIDEKYKKLAEVNIYQPFTPYIPLSTH